jgi:hypothetical protein
MRTRIDRIGRWDLSRRHVRHLPAGAVAIIFAAVLVACGPATTFAAEGPDTPASSTPGETVSATAEPDPGSTGGKQGSDTADTGDTTISQTGSTGDDDPDESTDTTAPTPVGQFSSWVGGGDPAPCSEEAGVPSPPYLGLGYGGNTDFFGSVVWMCFLDFGPESPVDVSVGHPDGTQSVFQVMIGATPGDVLSDPLAGDTLHSTDGVVSWIMRSAHPEGTYQFTATQADLTLSTEVEFIKGLRPFVEALDSFVPIGGTVTFALSGLPPNMSVPLAVYRDTGVLDTASGTCDGCSIFELLANAGPVAADANGAAVTSLSIDDSYQRRPPEKGVRDTNAFCLVVVGGEPVCDAFTAGWFEVQG